MVRQRRAIVPLAGVSLVALSLWGVYRMSDVGKAASDLDRQRAAAKREGVPTSYADLRRLSPPIPVDDNAAASYTQAFATLHASGAFKKGRTDTFLKKVEAGTLTPEDRASLQESLSLIEPALEEAKEGTRRKGFAFDRQWELGTALVFPEYADAKTLVGGLTLRAMLAKEPGHAADDLRAAARMRRDFGSEPILIGSLVGSSMETTIHRAVRFLGSRGGVWTRAMATVPAVLGPIPALRQTLAGEAVWSVNFDRELAKSDISAFLTMSSGDGEGRPPTPFVLRLMKIPAVRDASMARIVAYWRKAWAKLPDDPTDYRVARQALTAPAPDSGPSYVLLDMLLPVFEGFTEVNARTEANRRLTQAALALWSGGTPKLEKDPFGKGALMLRRDGKEWTLYSVGPDGKDDGGHPREGGSGKGYDLVVTSDPQARS